EAADTISNPGLGHNSNDNVAASRPVWSPVDPSNPSHYQAAFNWIALEREYRTDLLLTPKKIERTDYSGSDLTGNFDLYFTNYSTQVEWKFDGYRLVFLNAADLTSQKDIWTVGFDGTSPTRLTTWSLDDDEPTWSPTGSPCSRILFRRTTSGTPSHEIWTVHANPALGET